MNLDFQPNDLFILIDPQLDFSPGGSLAVPNGDEILPLVNEMLAEAQASSIPVIVTRDWHPADHVSFKEQGGPWPPHCVQDTKGAEFHPDLKLPDDYTIIQKAFKKDDDPYSCFQGGQTPGGATLQDTLKTLNPNRIWFAGLALDYCVQTAVLDACKAGYDCIVVLDATRGITPDSSQKAIEDMKAAGAVILNNLEDGLSTQQMLRDEW